MNSIDAYGLLQRRRRRSGQAQRKAGRRIGRGLLGLGAVLLLAGALGLVVLAGLYASLTYDLPSIEALPALLHPQDGAFLRPTRLYDRTGQHVIRSLSVPGVQRRYLHLDGQEDQRLSPNLVQATLAAADTHFYQHSGYSLDGISSGDHSTLAQRLVSEILLINEPAGLRRALRERLLAAQITATFGRDQVLEWYLNSAYYGHLAYGAEAAAQTFLGKSATRLTQAEAALLAGVAKAPALNPLDAPEPARQRQKETLDRMLDQGVLSTAQHRAARDERVVFLIVEKSKSEPALAFTAQALTQVAEEFGLARVERGGLDITTTLDYDLQLQVSCATQVQVLRAQNLPTEKVTSLDGSPCQTANLLPTLVTSDGTVAEGLTGSAVVLDPSSGEVLALVGETNARGETAALLSHPAGTLLTPFIYFSGFTRGMGPASLVWDLPPNEGELDEVDIVTPVETVNRGPLRLRSALATDAWMPAWTLLREIGSQQVWSLASQFGLEVTPPTPFSLDEQPDFTFGSVHPLGVAQAYAVFAANGTLAGQPGVKPGSLSPSLILTVRDAGGQILLDRHQPQSRPLVSPALAYLLHSILSDESARWPSLGHPNPLEIGRPAAAKMGILPTQSAAWTAGYIPQRVIVVWMGVPDSVGSGAQLDPLLSAGLWHATMQFAARDLPPTGWDLPAGVTRLDVCDPSGLLATAACPQVVSEVFLTGSEPHQPDTLFREFQVNRETGRLATVFTPPELVEERVFLVVPAEAQDWARATGLPVPPDEYDTIQVHSPPEGVGLDRPAMFSVVRGLVELRGTAAGENFSLYRVQAGRGLNPLEWLQVGPDGTRAVKDNLLARWDTTGLSGLYALRLVVVRDDQRVDSAIIQVTVDNEAPEVHITYPAQGETLTRASGQALTLQAQASDSIGLERVEWFIDDRRIASQTQAPFSLPWTAVPGGHTLRVEVYDLAGNQAVSQAVDFTIVRP